MSEYRAPRSSQARHVTDRSDREQALNRLVSRREPRREAAAPEPAPAPAPRLRPRSAAIRAGSSSSRSPPPFRRSRRRTDTEPPFEPAPRDPVELARRDRAGAGVLRDQAADARHRRLDVLFAGGAQLLVGLLERGVLARAARSSLIASSASADLAGARRS